MGGGGGCGGGGGGGGGGLGHIDGQRRLAVVGALPVSRGDCVRRWDMVYRRVEYCSVDHGSTNCHSFERTGPSRRRSVRNLIAHDSQKEQFVYKNAIQIERCKKAVVYKNAIQKRNAAKKGPCENSENKATKMRPRATLWFKHPVSYRSLNGAGGLKPGNRLTATFVKARCTVAGVAYSLKV